MALASPPLGFQTYPISTGSPFELDDSTGEPEILEASTTQFHVRPDAPPLKVSLPADRQVELSRTGGRLSKREELDISSAGFRKLDVDHLNDQSTCNISLQSFAVESEKDRFQKSKSLKDDGCQSRHNGNICQVSLAVELEKPPMNLAAPTYQRDVQQAPLAATPYVQLGLRPGAAVALYNLKEAADASLNGVVGVLEFWNQNINRWSVRLPNGEQKFVQPVNLLELTNHPSGVHQECPAAGVAAQKTVEEDEQRLCNARRNCDATAAAGPVISSRRNSDMSTGSRGVPDASATLSSGISSRRYSLESKVSFNDKDEDLPRRRISDASTTLASACSSRRNSMESVGSLDSQVFDVAGAAAYILSSCRNASEFERAVDDGVFDVMKIETKSAKAYNCEKTSAKLGGASAASQVRAARCPRDPVPVPNVSSDLDGASMFVPSDVQGSAGRQRIRYPRIRNRTMSSTVQEGMKQH